MVRRQFGIAVPSRAADVRAHHESGYDHLVMEVVVQKIEPGRLFSFDWHPYAIDPRVDYSHEPPTLVEFRLEPIATGTRLTVTESGFDAIPAARCDEAFRMNSQGWAIQVERIGKYVAACAANPGICGSRGGEPLA